MPLSGQPRSVSVRGYTFNGSYSDIEIFASLLKRAALESKHLLSLGNKFFPLSAALFLLRKANEFLIKLPPLL